jgi:hypothetical protein
MADLPCGIQYIQAIFKDVREKAEGVFFVERRPERQEK